MRGGAEGGMFLSDFPSRYRFIVKLRGRSCAFNAYVHDGEGESSLVVGYPELVSLKVVPSCSAFFKGSPAILALLLAISSYEASSPFSGSHHPLFPALPSHEGSYCSCTYHCNDRT